MHIHEFSSIKACDTSRYIHIHTHTDVYKADTCIYTHIHNDTDTYRHIHSRHTDYYCTAPCPVILVKMPAFPGARATREGPKDLAKICFTSTCGPWFGPLTTLLGGIEAINYFKFNTSIQVCDTSRCMHIQTDTDTYRPIQNDVLIKAHVHIYTSYMQIHTLLYVPIWGLLWKK
jgi:hypothetical protein